MQAYIFQADIYCAECAAAIEIDRNLIPIASNDSDVRPQGPYPDGGGEADCPQCCGACGVFLENPLTPEGDSYVRKEAAFYDAPDSSWEEIATRADNAGQCQLGQWIRFYFAPGQ